LRYISSTDAISKQYNGNIAEMLYKGQLSGSKTFIYSYDQLNRLGKATSNDNLLNEQLTYDLQGNIMSLVRTGNSSASLAYTYQSSNQSNQLQTVLNSGSAFRNYAYDANGNATSDGTNKTIAYNLLDLPQTVTQGATTLATYTYDAAGQKLRNTGSDGSWDYISGIVYNNNAISFIQTEEGRAIPNGGNYHYEYNLTDLLGNVRVSFDKNPTDNTVRTLQEDEYYAFGLRSLKQDNSSHNRYLYNGKEIQTDLTNQYDYGARFYDPVIARWATPDPLAEINRRWSPYNYVENNPIRFTDPDGMDIYDPNADLPKGDGQDQMDQQTADAEKRSALLAGVNRALSGNGPGDPKKKDNKEAKKDKERLSSKVSRWTNYAAVGTIVIGLGPEDLPADAVAGSEELLGQSAAGLIRLIEAGVDLYNLTKEHGNSDNNSDPHIVYEIMSTDMYGIYRTEKYGISGREDNQDGNNGRPAYQVNKFNKADPTRVYSWVNLARTDGRASAKTIETFLVTEYARRHNFQLPPKQLLPLPKL
jgi:RHS repeat-associated protein